MNPLTSIAIFGSAIMQSLQECRYTKLGDTIDTECIKEEVTTYPNKSSNNSRFRIISNGHIFMVQEHTTNFFGFSFWDYCGCLNAMGNDSDPWEFNSKEEAQTYINNILRRENSKWTVID